MYSIIYNLDGQIRDKIVGAYSDAQFTWKVAKKGAIIPMLQKEEKSINCNYAKTYPTDIKKLGRVAFYQFDGKDYTQLGLDRLPLDTKNLTLADYVAQYKLGVKTKESMIKPPSAMLMMNLMLMIMTFLMIIAVGYIASQANNAVHGLTGTVNASLNTMNKQNLLIVNQTQLLGKVVLQNTLTMRNLTEALAIGKT